MILAQAVTRGGQISQVVTRHGAAFGTPGFKRCRGICHDLQAHVLVCTALRSQHFAVSGVVACYRAAQEDTCKHGPQPGEKLLSSFAPKFIAPAASHQQSDFLIMLLLLRWSVIKNIAFRIHHCAVSLRGGAVAF